MPITTSESSFIMKIINVTGASLYPIALSLLLPVFMYAIVLEKEERLQEMMKMNGMKMAYYWLVNYLWNYLLYMMTVTIFYLFGYFILELTFFTQTNKFLMVKQLLKILFNWFFSFWYSMDGEYAKFHLLSFSKIFWEKQELQQVTIY